MNKEQKQELNLVFKYLTLTQLFSLNENMGSIRSIMANMINNYSDIDNYNKYFNLFSNLINNYSNSDFNDDSHKLYLPLIELFVNWSNQYKNMQIPANSIYSNIEELDNYLKLIEENLILKKQVA